MSLQIALFQPDIPGNCGTILRLAACLNLTLHIIEPAGFDVSDRAFKRAGMDYLNKAHLKRHIDWDNFKLWADNNNSRLILFTTKSKQIYTDFQFQEGDILLFGRESAGVPDWIYDQVHTSLTIPMAANARSINIALSVAMGAGEACRQLNLFKHDL